MKHNDEEYNKRHDHKGSTTEVRPGIQVRRRLKLDRGSRHAQPRLVVYPHWTLPRMHASHI